MAEKHQLSSNGDLARVASSVKSGTTFAFSNREDGLLWPEAYYGFKLGENLPIDSAPCYTALMNKEVDELQQSPQRVAREFLTQMNLIP